MAMEIFMRERSKVKMIFVLVKLYIHNLGSVNSHILILGTGKYFYKNGDRYEG